MPEGAAGSAGSGAAVVGAASVVEGAGTAVVGAASLVGAASVAAGAVVATAADVVTAAGASLSDPHPAATRAATATPAARTTESLVRISIGPTVTKHQRDNAPGATRQPHRAPPSKRRYRGRGTMAAPSRGKAQPGLSYSLSIAFDKVSDVLCQPFVLFYVPLQNTHNVMVNIWAHPRV